jgi:hypothetical protein
MKFGSAGWGLGVRLMNCLCKETVVARSNEVKTGWYTLAESFKGSCSALNDDVI